MLYITGLHAGLVEGTWLYLMFDRHIVTMYGVLYFGF